MHSDQCLVLGVRGVCVTHMAQYFVTSVIG